jgi:hypothetical protein
MPLAMGLLTMAVAQLFDLGTFVTMVRRLGPSAEANPIVSAILGSDGLSVLVLAKLLLVVVVGGVAVSLMTTRGPRARLAGQVLLTCAIVAGLIGGWSNALTMGPL